MRPTFGKHWWMLMAPTWIGLIAIGRLGGFDGWLWWQTLLLYVATGALVGELADILYDRAQKRASRNGETPP